MTIECGFCGDQGTVSADHLKLYTRPMHSLVKGHPSLDRHRYYGVCQQCRKDQRSMLPSTPDGSVSYAFTAGDFSSPPYDHWQRPSRYLSDVSDPYQRDPDITAWQSEPKWRPEFGADAAWVASIELLARAGFEWAGEHGFDDPITATAVWDAAKRLRPDLEPGA